LSKNLMVPLRRFRRGKLIDLVSIVDFPGFVLKSPAGHERTPAHHGAPTSCRKSGLAPGQRQ